jgi:hypothetical protein
MLYKFKSKATGDVIMLEANGRRVLEIIGKGAAGPGILLPATMPAAVAALEQAIVQEEAARQAALQTALAAGKEVPQSETISLRQRALPFIELLRRSHQADEPVVWGV